MCNHEHGKVKMNPKFRVEYKWIDDQMVKVNVTGPEGTRCVLRNGIVVAVFVNTDLVYCVKGFVPCDAV